MRDDESAEFKGLMGGLAVVFKEQLTPELIEIYWRVLRKYSVEQVACACSKLIETGKWFPKPAEIIEAIQALPPPVVNRKQIGQEEMTLGQAVDAGVLSFEQATYLRNMLKGAAKGKTVRAFKGEE